MVKTQIKLQEVKDQFPDLHIVLIEASPREEDMEWDRIMTVWEDWFGKIGVENYYTYQERRHYQRDGADQRNCSEYLNLTVIKKYILKSPGFRGFFVVQFLRLVRRLDKVIL